MANVYHWLTGSRDDVYSGKRLNYGTIVTNSSRYGSDSAFQVGTTTNSNDTMSTNYTYGGSVPVETGLPNLGTGDATIAFWWQPNNSAYGGSGQRHLFQYSTGLEVYHNASISTDTQDDYNLVAKFNYGDSGGYITKTFDIDLTGNPWIKIYASRIGGAFYYTLFDATGSVITDNDGNQSTWSNSSYTSDIYNASGSIPHIRVGGDFASGQTAGGIYDDIFLTLGHGIAAADLETDSDGYAKIDPVINSFSTSATSATNGSSVTLSWDTSFGTTLELLKYVGGLLTNTETVTGQVSKSVTISETVSYKLRATNVYGSVDSESVEITLSNGGNNMAVLSSKVILPVEVLGAVQVDADGALSSSVFAVGADATELANHRMLNSGFSLFDPSIDAPKNIIHAFNMVGASLDTKIGLAGLSVNDAGGDGSLSYDNTSGVFTYTGPSADEVRAHFSAVDSKSIDFALTAGQISGSLKAAVAGNGLGFDDEVLSVNVDDSSIEISSDTLQVKAGGITNAMLGGSIASTKIAELNNFSTANLSEGSNLYFTDARARAAISVTDAGGDGSMAYNSTTGVLTYTGPSASEVRAHLSAGAALDLAGGEFSLKVDDSSVEVNGSDKLQVKAGGISNAMLGGSIENEKLSNSTISGVSLGGTLGALSAAGSGGITVSSYNGSAAVSDLAVDKTQAFDWSGVHKFDEPVQLLDQDNAGVYYKLKIQDGLLKVESAS